MVGVRNPGLTALLLMIHYISWFSPSRQSSSYITMPLCVSGPGTRTWGGGHHKTPEGVVGTEAQLRERSFLETNEYNWSRGLMVKM